MQINQNECLVYKKMTKNKTKAFSPSVYLWSCEVGKKYAAPNSYYMQPSSFAAASPRHK